MGTTKIDATGVTLPDATVLTTIPGTNYSSTQASDVLRISDDTEKSTTALSDTKLKEILLNEPLPACRIKFDLKASLTDGAFGTIYKNGIAIGTPQSTSQVTYQTFSQDFTGFVATDKIQIYVLSGSGLPAYVANFRIYYDVGTRVISTTNQDP